MLRVFHLVVGVLVSAYGAMAMIPNGLTATFQLILENVQRPRQLVDREVNESKWKLQGVKLHPKCNEMPEIELASYSTEDYVKTLGSFQTIWTMIDLLFGQFLFIPVSGSSVTWSRTIPGGNLAKQSSTCTSYTDFRMSLAGMEVSRIVLVAGSISVECSNRTIAQQIIDAFSAGTVRGLSCHGNSWLAGTCGGDSSISVAREGESKACECFDNEAVMIRPCIDNSNWGGTGSDVCGSVTTTLSISVYRYIPTNMPTAMPTETPTTAPTLSPTSSPTETPTTLPTGIPSHLPTETPTDQPTLSIIQYEDPVDSIITDFDIVDKNGDEYLNYEEIVFAIADTAKDGRLSLDEYQAARAEGHFIDTSYSQSNFSTPNSPDFADVTKDFGIIDRNHDEFLNYDEIAFAIADITKDGKLSILEYKAARTDGIFIDTSYTLE